MCNFTDAIPTGDHAISQGNQVVIGVKKVLDLNLGTGTVTQLNSDNFEANGEYSAFGKSGTWSASLTSSDGNSWNLSIVLEGDINNSFNIENASCNEQGSGDDTTITYTGDGQSMVQSYQNDSWVEKAKIWFAVPFNGTTYNLYFYNANYDDSRVAKIADFKGEKPLTMIRAEKYAVVPYHNNELGISDVGLRLDGKNTYGILEDPDANTMQMVLNAFSNHQSVYFAVKSGFPFPRVIQLIKIGNA
ncbi:MAG: hypothetical protein R2825_10445 [Saprospiraceae bacterium]